MTSFLVQYVLPKMFLLVMIRGSTKIFYLLNFSNWNYLTICRIPGIIYVSIGDNW